MQQQDQPGSHQAGKNGHRENWRGWLLQTGACSYALPPTPQFVPLVLTTCAPSAFF